MSSLTDREEAERTHQRNQPTGDCGNLSWWPMGRQITGVGEADEVVKHTGGEIQGSVD